MNRLAYLGLGALTLLAVAGTASALPLGLSHNVATPAGSVSADYADYAASTCIRPAVPALPALPAVPAVPALPVSLPIGIPALPSAPAVSGAATVCADASENGIHANAVADAMGAHAETGADVDTSEQAKTVKQTAGGIKGLLEDLGSAIQSLF
ncbi:MAG: hypothetical protein AABY18_08795 [Candidatus Thermoplasmatota archaeon]